MTEKYIKVSECEKYFYEHLDDAHIAGAMNAIDEIPAADVQPVIHAKWIEDYIMTKFYTCSNCKKYKYKRYNYCPDCGAKMDGGNGDENT